MESNQPLPPLKTRLEQALAAGATQGGGAWVPVGGPFGALVPGAA
eukprot:CAMPEP_0119285400 /NCGR_PEP_ID=MMETSP1329-20130426/32112_1 /TAXON_ID=114041 /ORGANISM="Genus nov. species nov., Strain RCC1024" /LENGTH=44 /DNA_ID= /DNA_START= /DNA_END= /DNA_ORIENTATION=